MGKIAPIFATLGMWLSLSALGAAEDGQPHLLWPEQPERPRVEFVRSVTDSADLGVEKGFFQRLTDSLFGETDSRLVRPMAVVATGDFLYVADPGLQGVHRYGLKSPSYRLLRREGDMALPSPVALAAGVGGEVLVSDSVLGRVFSIPEGGRFVKPTNLSFSFERPTGLAFDPGREELYVVDTPNHYIHVFNSAGERQRSFGGRGEAPGEFNLPTHIWFGRDGLLYVTDSMNFRVQVLNRQGAVQSVFGKPGDGTGDIARHKGIATDSYGHVYLVDGMLHSLQIFDGQGRLLIAIGALGREAGEFWLPSGISIDSDDTIYVADTYNRRVQVFRYIGGSP